MTTLHFTESGTPGKPTLIFLHGLAMGGWMWTDQIASFADYHLLNIEMPGHGDSHAVPWKSMADTADLVAEVIANHATNGRAHVIGLSLGGLVGLHVLLRHPHRVERAIISGSPASEPTPKLMYQLQSRLVGLLLNTPLGVKVFARMLFIPSEAMEVFTAFIKKLSRPMYWSVVHELMSFVLPPGMSQIAAPTLLVTGEKDIAFNVESVRTLAAVLPNNVAVLAPQVHHGWNGEAPQLFDAMMRAWIEQKPLPESMIPIRTGQGSGSELKPAPANQ